jgi:hypothetical protein
MYLLSLKLVTLKLYLSLGKSRIERRGQPEKDRYNRTARTGKPEWDRQDKQGRK